MAGNSTDNPNDDQSEDEFNHPPPRAPKDKAPNPSGALSCTHTTVALSIMLIHTKDYSTVSRIAVRDHLDDDNWYEWKEHFR